MDNEGYTWRKSVSWMQSARLSSKATKNNDMETKCCLITYTLCTSLNSFHLLHQLSPPQSCQSSCHERGVLIIQPISPCVCCDSCRWENSHRESDVEGFCSRFSCEALQWENIMGSCWTLICRTDYCEQPVSTSPFVFFCSCIFHEGSFQNIQFVLLTERCIIHERLCFSFFWGWIGLPFSIGLFVRTKTSNPSCFKHRKHCIMENRFKFLSWRPPTKKTSPVSFGHWSPQTTHITYTTTRVPTDLKPVNQTRIPEGFWPQKQQDTEETLDEVTDVRKRQVCTFWTTNWD